MTTHDSTTLSPADAVRALHTGYLTGDLEMIRRVIHPDVVTIEPDSLPYGGVHEGADKFFGVVLAGIAERFEFRVDEDADIFERPGGVAARVPISITSRKTGATLRMPYVEIYEVRDGTLRHIDVYPQDAGRVAEFMAAN